MKIASFLVMYFNRFLQPEIIKNLGTQKVSLLLGARRVGKSELIHYVTESIALKFLLLNGEDADTQALLEERSVANYRRILGNNQLLIIDEAQNIPDIARKAKLMIDSIQPLHILLTGSSAFDIAQYGEALTGRSVSYFIYPLCQAELSAHENLLQTRQNIEERLIYGSYPELFSYPDLDDKERYLKEIANHYLLRDILAFERIQLADKIRDLLKLLAWQVGNEVSHEELGRNLNMSKNTVERYLDLLAKVFIIYKRSGYSGNLRKEVAKSSKWYFYDNGIRNAVIGQFQPLALRQDTGALWENYILSERLKWNAYRGHSAHSYFWRTYDKQEIDLIETHGNTLNAFEIKWKANLVSTPKAFEKAYPHAGFSVINQKNYLEFIGG